MSLHGHHDLILFQDSVKIFFISPRNAFVIIAIGAGALHLILRLWDGHDLQRGFLLHVADHALDLIDSTIAAFADFSNDCPSLPGNPYTCHTFSSSVDLVF